jgi:hypothetical protein
MRSVAYTTGYSYKRWKRGLDVQLLKKAKVFIADKLRTILLLEADFNMNNKALGSDAMRIGERTKNVARDNYGGRKYLQAPEVGMNSKLSSDSIWARRGRAILMSNDAKGCYDRIAHIVVDLALQRLGLPRPALSSMLNTIQEMDHYVRTAFGDSEGHYGPEANRPPAQGILQGNGAGPAGWFAISTVLIQTLTDEGFGLREWSLISQRAVSITCFAFVDDTDIIHVNNDRTVPTQELIHDAQRALWEDLLTATGGALAPNKSYWYLVEVIWKDHQWQYATQDDRPGNLFLRDGTVVWRCEPNEANEALGMMARPDGCMDSQYTHLHNSFNNWCDAVRSKRVHRDEAWYCLNRTIMKTIEYCLVATSLSRTQVDDLMRPIFKLALNAASRKTSLASSSTAPQLSEV